MDVPILCFSATVMIFSPFNLAIWAKSSWVPDTSKRALIISKAALSIATGSVEANIPISWILGSGAWSPVQSHQIEIFAITEIKAIPPLALKYSTTDAAASPILAVKSSWLVLLAYSIIFVQSVIWPAEWIYVLPLCELKPILNCLRAPPNPPIGCPLKWDKTRALSNSSILPPT